MTESPKMKVYGLIHMTRATWARVQAVVFLFLAGCLAVAVAVAQNFDNVVADRAPWIIGLVIVLEIGETVWVLRKFRAAERE